MTNIRSKGQRGEREAAAFLGSILNQRGISRNLSQTREGGADIIAVPGLCIEVKRQETLNVNTWWRQVCVAADDCGDIPVLMYRQNKRRWHFCLPAYLLVLGTEGYITLGEDVFVQWLVHFSILE